MLSATLQHQLPTYGTALAGRLPVQLSKSGPGANGLLPGEHGRRSLCISQADKSSDNMIYLVDNTKKEQPTFVRPPRPSPPPDSNGIVWLYNDPHPAKTIESDHSITLDPPRPFAEPPQNTNRSALNIFQSQSATLGIPLETSSSSLSTNGRNQASHSLEVKTLGEEEKVAQPVSSIQFSPQLDKKSSPLSPAPSTTLTSEQQNTRASAVQQPHKASPFVDQPAVLPVTRSRSPTSSSPREKVAPKQTGVAPGPHAYNQVLAAIKTETTRKDVDIPVVKTALPMDPPTPKKELPVTQEPEAKPKLKAAEAPLALLSVESVTTEHHTSQVTEGDVVTGAAIAAGAFLVAPYTVKPVAGILISPLLQVVGTLFTVYFSMTTLLPSTSRQEFQGKLEELRDKVFE